VQTTKVITRFVCLGMVLVACAASSPAQQAEPAQAQSAAPAGVVTGTVYDSQTGNAIRGALVKVVQGEQSAITDIDGRYRLSLPAGTYRLQVSAPGYFQQPVDDVVVAARGTVYIDPVLVPTTIVRDDKVVVTADTPQTATVKSALLERKMADTIMDNISAEDIKKNPDSDAAAVLERVTGVSVIDDKFVYVRGLGERYSSTMLNGSAVPSTEPEKKVVAFDLFPAALLNKITTIKSYTPDQPGDFSGALVKIDTMEFPAEFTLKYSASIGFNTNVSMRYFREYAGGRLDWLGFGVQSRRLPDAFPEERVTRRNEITGTGFAPEQLQAFGRQLKNEWEARDGKAAPDFSQSIATGGSWGNLGTVFSMTFSRKFSRLLETVNSYQAVGGRLLPWNLFTNDKNTETVKMGLVGNVSYKLGQDHKLLFKNFYTADSSDETRFLYGFSNGNTADERDTRLRYLRESMWTSQASGQHYLKPLGNGLLEWRLAHARAARQEPDLRETIYRSEEGKNRYVFSPEGQSGFRQFSDQQDRIWEPGLDYSLFFFRSNFNVSVKFGGLYQQRRRDFSSRRFAFLIYDRSLDLTQSPERLFAPENIAPNRIELREITRFTDTFDARQKIYAGYGMSELSLGRRWRLQGGLRFEKSQIGLRTFDPYKPALEPLVTTLDRADRLPAASAVYMIRDDMNLRASFSRTLNRPEFRELAPFQFTDISGRSTILGNPQLQQSKIDNYDLRWEWFRGGDELYAVSVFAKRFRRPIERVLFYAADVLTSYANIDGATNKGVEMEIKKKLGFLSRRLENFSLQGNYSRIFSEVRIGDLPGLVMTSKERPLQGQSSCLANGVLEYENPRTHSEIRLLYNLVGRRISEVGATGLPDVYERPNHFLDLSYGQRLPGQERVRLKFTIQNILNRAITELQGDRIFGSYRLGRTFGIGISYDIY